MFSSGRSFSGNERNCCYLNIEDRAGEDGSFVNISATSGIDFPDDGRALAITDWDQDGDLDVWISNRNAPRLRFLENQSNNQNQQVSFQLVGNGVSTNRDAIGARIEIFPAKGKETTSTGKTKNRGNQPIPPFVQTLRAGEGFLSQNSKRVTFGLGALTAIEKVAVSWPGGEQEFFDNIQPGSVYELVQGSEHAQRLPRREKTTPLQSREQEPNHSANGTFTLATHIELPKLFFESWDGELLPLKASKGKSLLVTFWASWCPSCLMELKSFAQEQQAFSDAGVDILALSVDALDGEPLGIDQANKILDQRQFYFRSGRATKKLIQHLQTLNILKTEKGEIPIPFSILLDYQNRLVSVYRGPVGKEKILTDARHKEGDILSRLEKSMNLEGHSLPGKVARDALSRAEADGRFKYAELLKRMGHPQDALVQYAIVQSLLPGEDRAYEAPATLLTKMGAILPAIKAWKDLLQLDPQSVIAHANLAGIYLQQSKPRLAIQHYKAGLESKPDDTQILQGLSLAYEQNKDIESAIGTLGRLLAIQPKSEEIQIRRGSLKMATGDLQGAREDFDSVITLNRENGLAYKKRGICGLRLGNNDQALLDLNKAITLLPNDSELYTNRGMAHAGAGNFAFAIDDYEKALKIQSDSPEILNNVAWLLATCPVAHIRNGEKALEYANRACELAQWSHFGTLDTLAAAYAAVGKYEEAAKWAKRSIEYAPEDRKAELQMRYNLYEAGEPYRMPKKRP